MMTLHRLADVSEPHSLSNRLRQRRFAWFESMTDAMPRPLRIIDVGGTALFWEQRGWAGRDDVLITTVNLEDEPQRWANITPMPGDATDLRGVADRSFDVAFSNSVIEHLFTFERQAAMAREVRRVARAYWVQTPNHWFPIEPHFHVPGWQWMPRAVRVAMLRRMQCGGRGPCPDRNEARRLVDEVRLMTRSELAALFPGATIRAERFGGLVKSWIAVRGLDAAPVARRAA